MMALFLQIVTWAQIWAAIAGQGYRLQPMACYESAPAVPVVCTMALHSSGDLGRGFLYVEVVGGRIVIREFGQENEIGCTEEGCG
jgi:hypothetical protein